MKIIFQTSDKTDSRVDQLIDRSEIEDKYKWRLQDIFKDDSEWEDAYTQIESMLPDITDYQGRLGKSAQTLYECLKLRDQIEEQFGRLYLYAGLNNDKDTRVGKYQEFRSRASSLMAKVNQTTSFIQPEILSIPEDTLDEFVESNQQLNTYRHYFDDLLRSKDHVLPPKQERLLAMTGEIAQGPYHIFSMFNNADIKFPTVRDENDQEMELTKGRYQKLMESQHRRVRKDSFDAFYGTYGEWTNTLAATLSTAIKRNIFYARARKYNNALEAALDADYIPVQVYDNVVNTINENLEPLHKYMCLRKKMLELDELHPWDLAVPLIHDVNFDIPYEETQETITNALKPLGEDYLSVLQKGFANGWIDVYENHGKRSGAFSWATYGVHPYILLNYNNTLNNMFTIAHELGHALHSYYTHQHQPYHYSHYTIFVAEVASTLNEALLIDYLLKHSDDPRRKLYLLNEYVDQIRGTVYIQTLFAEFERTIHQKVEAGQALTAETLRALNRELYLRYFGPEFVMEHEYDINWCRIPHFYYNFYVYKYVTGFSAATALAQKILAGDTETRDAYLQFLTRGSSDYSINLLRDAGVDMTSPKPIEATTKLLSQLVEEMASLSE